jgi:hypothetical protein
MALVITHTFTNGFPAIASEVNTNFAAVKAFVDGIQTGTNIDTGAIVDSKLATISTAGKVANSATTATNNNVINTIVSRDPSGNFSAGTITATLTGTASYATNAGTAGTASSASFANSANTASSATYATSAGTAATAGTATTANYANSAGSIANFNKGSNVVTTNGSGLASFTHGLGATPVVVLVHNGDLGAYFGQINFWSADAGNITIAAGASLSVRVNWIAYL